MFERTELQRLAAKFYDSEIADLYGCDRTNVRYWRKKLDIPSKQVGRGRPRTVSLDVDFFSTINTEPKAYILGLLSADGYVHKDGKSVSIALKADDEQMLQDIRSAMKSNSPIRKKPNRGGYGDGGHHVVTNFCSRKLVADLAFYGVVPRKSYTLAFPALPSSLERHFIRGVWDGDGNISRRNFSVLGTRALIDGIRASVLSHVGIPLSECPLGAAPRLVGYRRDKEVIHWLYSGSTISLERKHRAFVEFWS